MYPKDELSCGAAHKATLRRTINLRRARCVEATTRVAQPLELLDRLVTRLRQLAPFIGLAAIAIS